MTSVKTQISLKTHLQHSFISGSFQTLYLDCVSLFLYNQAFVIQAVLVICRLYVCSFTGKRLKIDVFLKLVLKFTNIIVFLYANLLFAGHMFPSLYARERDITNSHIKWPRMTVIQGMGSNKRQFLNRTYAKMQVKRLHTTRAALFDSETIYILLHITRETCTLKQSHKKCLLTKLVKPLAADVTVSQSYKKVCIKETFFLKFLDLALL